MAVTEDAHACTLNFEENEQQKVARRSFYGATLSTQSHVLLKRILIDWAIKWYQHDCYQC